MGWSATLQDAKLISEGLLLMGIPYLVPHGFFYTTEALTKHDAPPTFFFQMPAWPLFRKLSDRIERITSEFENTWIDAEIAVLDPHSGFPSSDHLKAYPEILWKLMNMHIEFLIADTDILESGEIKNGKVYIKNVCINTVILPPMEMIEEPFQKWINTFKKEGGHVLLPESAEEVASVADTVEPYLDITCLNGESADIQIVTRTDGKKKYWLCINYSGEKRDIEISRQEVLSEIPLDPDLPPMLKRENNSWKRVFHPFESVLFVQQESDPDDIPEILEIPVPQNMHITPLNKNLVRMGEWSMSIVDEKGNPGEEKTVEAIPLINQLAQGGFQFEPSIRKEFARTMKWELPQLNVVYSFEFENDYNGNVELVMEPGSIIGKWEVSINGKGNLVKDDFKKTDAHVRGSLGADITQYIAKGKNRIEVKLVTDKKDGGLLNSLYLAGDFGVALDPITLTEQPEQGVFEAWEQNGLPFYAGVIEYTGEAEIHTIPETESTLTELEFPVPFQDACEVCFNGNSWYSALWSPYIVSVPVSELTQGTNTISIRVYTSLVRSFEGTYWDIGSHSYRTVGE
jgi:hypothetical protein